MVQSPAMAEVRALYYRMIASWNQQDAAGFAGCLSHKATVIGFDGSVMTGAADVENTLRQIFADHPTPIYIVIERRIRTLAPNTVLYLADVGMVPRGKSDLDPGLNARQTLVATQHNERWAADLLQNTPASLHGRPDLTLALTEELKVALSRT